MINQVTHLNNSIKSGTMHILGKQLKYADRKGIPYVVVIGPDEAKSNVVKLKDMKTGEEKLLKSADVVRLLTAA